MDITNWLNSFQGKLHEVFIDRVFLFSIDCIVLLSAVLYSFAALILSVWCDIIIVR